ncbi:MAG: ABC transporter substrate-binding protein [Dehalococcoidales bacterium]|nr:ABC transporter substrate-binding protein [Dehalococcoidales bacterium]
MLLPACQAEEAGEVKEVEKEEPAQPEIKNPGTFIYATIGPPDTMDPAYAYDTASGEIIQSVYETLLFWKGESTTEFDPILATEWTMSDDGKTYRFKIRSGVKFHNGNTLTPEDVEYSFERGMVQDYGAGPQWMIFEPLFGTDTHSSRTDDGLIPLDELKSKVEVDGDWVQFNLVAPYEPFLQILSNSWGSVLDKEWCIENGDWDGTQASYEALNDPPSGGSPLQKIMNGTGPFKLERWDEGVETVLVRNDSYWRTKAKLERVVIKVVEEWTTRRLMLEAGDADQVDVPRAHIDELEDVEGLTIWKDLPSLSNDAIFFQFDISEESTFTGSGKLDGAGIPSDFFSDLDVRKGMTYAFNYDVFLTDALKNEAQQVGSPIVEGLSYYDANAPKPSWDLAKAEEHFKKAWGGEVWETGFTFTIAYNAGNVTRKIGCEILQENLFNINEKFTVLIQVMQWPTLLRGMYGGLLPMFQIGWLADYPDAHNFVFPFQSSAGTFSGWQNYANAEVDALIAEGISGTTSAAREATYRELDQLYFDDAPSFIVAQALGRRYFRSWVKGFYYNPVLPGPFGNLYTLSKEY